MSLHLKAIRAIGITREIVIRIEDAGIWVVRLAEGERPHPIEITIVGTHDQAIWASTATVTFIMPASTHVGKTISTNIFAFAFRANHCVFVAALARSTKNNQFVCSTTVHTCLANGQGTLDALKPGSWTG